MTDLHGSDRQAGIYWSNESETTSVLKIKYPGAKFSASLPVSESLIDQRIPDVCPSSEILGMFEGEVFEP
jgi:hypothetical protein